MFDFYCLSSRQVVTATLFKFLSFRHYLATAQAIAAFAVPDYKAGPQLEYIIEEENRRNAKKEPNMFIDLASAVAKQFAAGARQVRDGIATAWKAFKKFCRKTFYRYAQIGVQEDENDEDEDEDGEALDQKLEALSQKIQEEMVKDVMDLTSSGGEVFPAIMDEEEGKLEDSIQPFEIENLPE
jgi:hypothetical protein